MGKQEVVGVVEASGPLSRDDVPGGEGTADHPMQQRRSHVGHITLVDGEISFSKSS